MVCFTSLRQDESIFLQCEHVLCYDCSKTIVAKLVVAQRQEALTYKCECCNTKTVLERDLVESLMKAAKIEIRAEEVSASRRSQARSLRKNLKPNNRAAEINLRKEPLEETNSPSADSLFCLDCQAGCFSIDAYLAGLHRNHNVKSIPKAYPMLVENTEELRM